LEFEAQLLEVTVTVTIAEVPSGVPVIMKSCDALVVVNVSLKKGVADAGSSGLAVTMMVAPDVGRVVMFTVNPKSGPGAGGSVLLMAGVEVKFMAASPQVPPSLEQA